jgi:hypothetical protein
VRLHGLRARVGFVPVLVRAGCLSGGSGGEGDVPAESLQLAGVAAGLLVVVCVAGVPVRAEVSEACVGVGGEVPDDGEDGARDRDPCAGAAAAFARRRSRSPGKVSVRAVPLAAWVHRPRR